MTYEPKKGDINGFSICGTKTTPSGDIKLDDGRVLESFPDEVYLLGVTYTLEEIVQEGSLIWGEYV